MSSMWNREAGKKAEKPEQSRKIGDGIADGMGTERQVSPAHVEKVEDRTLLLMEEVLCRSNMFEALKRVSRNKGAPGADGLSTRELGDFLKKHWKRIRQEILDGQYVPQPVLKVEIPKPGGGKRLLGIPTVLDRLIQQALLQIFHPIFDPSFSELSFGFRPKRSTHQAVLKAREYMKSGRRWVVDLDLEKFFDQVNHDMLMARVAHRIKDKRVLILIRRFLQAGIMDQGIVKPRDMGTPQGGPLSPLLSNILLDDLDKELERRGHCFVRYADDCNVYVKSRRAGDRVLASIKEFVRVRLRLKVNCQKSAVDRPWNRKFLGYTFTTNFKPRLKVAKESARRFKEKLKEVLRRGRGQSIREVLRELAPKLRGWASYYRLASVKVTFEDLDKWIRRRIRLLYWRRWKKPKYQRRQLFRRGVPWRKACKAAYRGRGPWFNSGIPALNQALPTKELRELGLLSLVEKHQSFANSK